MKQWIVFVVILMFFAVEGELYAKCRCTASMNVEDALRKSDVVLSGRVVEILNVDSHNIVVQIENYNVWKKGVLLSRHSKPFDRHYTYLLSSYNKDACGFNFKLGNEYLIYSDANKNGNLIVTSCNKSRDLRMSEGIKADILSLGKPLSREEINGMARKQ